jgi:hypothetical protein
MRHRVFIISVLIFFFSGCAGTTLHHIVYHDGTVLPQSQITELEVPRDLHVKSLDGVTSDDLSAPWGNTHIYQLYPGEHKIEVYYSPIITVGDPYGHPMVLTWYAEPGHKYIIKYEANPPWWSAWVEPKPEH